MSYFDELAKALGPVATAAIDELVAGFAPLTAEDRAVLGALLRRSPSAPERADVSAGVDDGVGDQVKPNISLPDNEEAA